jgi:uncharacterized protein (DUF2147 family)
MRQHAVGGITMWNQRAAAYSIVVAFTIAVSVGGGLAADKPVGNWNTVDDKTGKVMSEVQLYDEDGRLYGKIVRLTDPTDASGKPKTCTKCQGADKDQPIVGLVIVKNLTPDKDRFKGGTILDPEDGKVYRAELWTEGDTLKVRGYLGPFYKTQTWTKAP